MGPVETSAATGAIDAGKTLRQELFAEMSCIEQHGPSILRRHLHRDSAGDDVSRREFRIRVYCLHKPPALSIQKQRPFTSYSLGDEKGLGNCKRGWMKLIELQICKLRTGAKGQCGSIAGCSCRIGSVLIELTGPAAGENNGIRLQLPPISACTQDSQSDGMA
jgi:hypothetical protein